MLPLLIDDKHVRRVFEAKRPAPGVKIGGHINVCISHVHAVIWDILGALVFELLDLSQLALSQFQQPLTLLPKSIRH
jgi:hypothetical protein